MMTKLKILCLHGYLQNSEIFRARIGSWRKGLKSKVDFIFIDAPHAIHDEEEEADIVDGRAGGLSWWLWEDTDQTPRPSKARKYTEWIPSIQTISEALQTHSPVDGFIGFSQGATMISLFLAHLQQEKALPDHVPRFALLVGGFLPRDDIIANYIVQGRPSMDSLHIYGRNDDLVEGSRSLDLMSTFQNCRTENYEHDGAHMMPTCSGTTKTRIIQFLDSVNDHHNLP
eukprot:g4089.t1